MVFRGPEETARLSSLQPGPDVTGAQDGFAWCHHLDLSCLVAKLPLVSVMWRGYAATCVGLRTISDR
jgi:hypothetical protein